MHNVNFESVFTLEGCFVPADVKFEVRSLNGKLQGSIRRVDPNGLPDLPDGGWAVRHGEAGSIEQIVGYSESHPEWKIESEPYDVPELATIVFNTGYIPTVHKVKEKDAEE